MRFGMPGVKKDEAPEAGGTTAGYRCVMRRVCAVDEFSRAKAGTGVDPELLS
jgi:hypothetical protein